MVVAIRAAPAGGTPERFVALDSLRGIAALFIVFYHMGDFGWVSGWTPFRSGWMLVDFFFVLSGFVIAMSYGARLAHGYPRGSFLLIRFGRVFPLHLAVVAGFTLLEFIVFRPILHQAHPPMEWVRGAFLLDAFAVGAGNFYAPVSWAVGVEMVLYALAALLFGRGAVAIAVAAMLAVAAAWGLWNHISVVGFGSLLQRGLFDFAIGLLTWRIHQQFARREISATLLTVLEIGLIALLIWLLWIPGKDGRWVLLAAPLFAAMVLVFARDRGHVARLLHAAPFVWLGKLSFALFMVHLFWVILPNRFGPWIFDALGHADWIAPGLNKYGLLSMAPPPALATAISLALLAGALTTAWLAWRTIEEPARHWTKRLAPPAK
ncbi:acyltransferase family protein [Erythrobacter sp. 3-20A1M]|nr:acyltransferase family protein [Erythrobacter sp. 3-20A1M]